MSSVNVVGRRFKITVAGLDVTPLVEHFDTGDDRVGSSGLIPTRGTIKLRYNPRWNEGRNPKISLDPKIPESALYWARGVPVKIWIDDSTLTQRKHPRHSLRVLRSTYDRYELSLTLEVGCLLALLDAPQPEGDESDTCVNETVPVNTIIANVLRGASKTYPDIVISYIGFVPGFLNSPQEKGSGGSYVAQAGSIAYSRGYALWVTKDEEIRAIKIAPGDSTVRIVLDADRDVMEYNRGDEDVESGEAPYNRIRVRYNLTILEETPQTYKSYSESFGATPSGGYSLVATSKITDSMRLSNRVIETVNSKPAAEVYPWIYTEKEIEEGSADIVVIEEIIRELYEYESVSEWDLNSEVACNKESTGADPKQGRLRRYTKEIYRPNWSIYQGWASEHDTAGALVYTDLAEKQRSARLNQISKSSTYFITNGITLAEKEITNYGYFQEDNSSFIKYTGVAEYSREGANTGTNETDETSVKVIQTQKWIHEAYVFPKAWAFKNGKFGSYPSGLVYAGRELYTWNKRLGSSEWEKRSVVTELIGRANSSIVEARLKRAYEKDLTVYEGSYNMAGDPLKRPESEQDRLRVESITSVRNYAKYVTPTLDKVEVSQTQCSPPAPEYVPERWSREEEEKVEEIYIVSPYENPTQRQGRIKEISMSAPIEVYKGNGRLEAIGGGGVNNLVYNYGVRGAQSDIEQATTLAKIESFLTWGRHRAVETTYDLRDIWFDLPYLPMTRFDILDRDRITDTVYRHSYVVDGWTNAVTLRECLCSHDGLWLGTTLGISKETIKFVEPILAGVTAIPVAPLGYELQEGDGVVLQSFAELSFTASVAGVKSLTLTTPLTTTLTAGTRILVEGQVIEIAQTINAGATTVPLTKSINVPLSNNASGTAGNIAIVSMFTPIGSTAIPVQPTQNTTTITPQTGIINVQRQLLTTQIPQQFNSIVKPFSRSISYQKQENKFSSIARVSYPAGNYTVIGTASFNSISRPFFSTSFTMTTIMEAISRVFFSSVQVQLYESISLAVANISTQTNSEFESISIAFNNPEIPTVAIAFTSIVQNISEFETTPSQTFSSIAVSVANIIPPNNTSNSFHLIAIW